MNDRDWVNAVLTVLLGIAVLAAVQIVARCSERETCIAITKSMSECQ